MTVNVTHNLLEKLHVIAAAAGREIMKIYGTDFAVETKADSSPVTVADRAAEELIVRAIRADITDKFPIVSEEAFAQGTRPEIAGTPFWLVDPLDGTKEFVKRNGEFTVNIALIDSGRPVAGVVLAPAVKQTYVAGPMGAFRVATAGRAESISCRQALPKKLTAMTSRHHSTPEVDAYLDNLGVEKLISAGSSLKFCRIAEGQADVYPRFSRTMEWDTAAGHAILRFAGGRITDRAGAELAYGKPGFENPHIVAFGPGVPVPESVSKA
ncbi:MAG: 3'(2'),5'-bisphosphate nucleotidase CysQ [Alphaproteobacteria bacterium]|nr:3'(2'),5'-bisphosphate nucleotidase CysQ [Alphaproteobacteria bacterium]